MNETCGATRSLPRPSLGPRSLLWAWRCCRRMSSTTPRETSGALPKWDGIQDADRTSIIKPIMEHFRQVTQAALQEHMNLVTSQYMTGWARASREGGIGAATPMNQPDLSNISAGNPVSTPDQTPVQRRRSPSRAYGGIVPGTSLREDRPETEPEPEGTCTCMQKVVTIPFW